MVSTTARRHFSMKNDTCDQPGDDFSATAHTLTGSVFFLARRRAKSGPRFLMRQFLNASPRLYKYGHKRRYEPKSRIFGSHATDRRIIVLRIAATAASKAVFGDLLRFDFWIARYRPNYSFSSVLSFARTCNAQLL